MNRGVYALAGGLVANQQWLDVTSNNLANASTAGFKADALSFDDMLVRQLNSGGGTGAAVGGLGSGMEAKSEYTDLSQGQVNVTGNPLDFAIQGSGMFAVQTSAGQVSYTRDGEFTQDASRTLTTKSGLPVLDDAGSPIVIPPGQVTVSEGGDISVDGKAPFAKIGVFQGTFVKTSTNLFSVSGQATTVAAGTSGAPTVKQGALEASNVTPATAMTDMIKLGRATDMAQKAIQSQDDMTTKLIQSMNS